MRVTLRSGARAAALLAVGLLMLGSAVWGALALFYWDHAAAQLRGGLALAYAAVVASLLVCFAMRPQWRWRAAAAAAALFALLLAAWFNIEPSNDRLWQPDNAVLAYASIDGDRVTLHNIRNFDYRSEHDFTAAYYDRSFDLRQLEGVDLFTVYWMGPAIAHVFLSFAFTDGAHLAISIEARREQGQAYSAIAGFFRQYPLYYAVGDERDIVRLRTNYRHSPPEEVYLYRLQGTPASARALFLEYLEQLNSLRDHARWYNSLTTNCTNTIWLNSSVLPGRARYSWKILLSGYVPELLYEQGKLDTRWPFEELRQRAHINARAQAADQAPDFSARIRAPSPGDVITPGRPVSSATLPAASGSATAARQAAVPQPPAAARRRG